MTSSESVTTQSNPPVVSTRKASSKKAPRSVRWGTTSTQKTHSKNSARAGKPPTLGKLTQHNASQLPRYTLHYQMAIVGFRHKGLAAFYSRGSTAGIQPKRGNWRVTFRFEGPDVTDVNYEDYH